MVFRLAVAAGIGLLGVWSAAAQEESVSWLFIVEAGSFRVEGAILTLSDLAPSTTAFTDRPHRIATSMPTTDFIGLWSTSDFRADPPNAGISYRVDGALQTAVVELSDPRDKATGVAYTVALIEGDLPTGGGPAILFVDAFPTAVNDQITDSITQTNVKVLGEAPAEAMGQLQVPLGSDVAGAEHNSASDAP